MTAAIDNYLDFRHELRVALRELSPPALRAVLWSWTDSRDASLRRLIALPDHALERVIRSMIVAEPQLADLHAAARLWLARNEAASAAAPPRSITPTDRRRRPARREPGLAPTSQPA
jgi:hypothetical protein